MNGINQLTVSDASADPEFVYRPRGSKHRVWLKDVEPFVFCQKYKKRHQRQKNGEWEVQFVNKRGRRFSLLVSNHPELIELRGRGDTKSCREMGWRVKILC